MDAPYSPLEYRLLNDWQRNFPLVAQPYAVLAQTLESDEESVIATLRRLQERGAISRVGAVFAPRRVGASTLAALAVPPHRLDEVAAMVTALPGVNHNYEREHRYNLWFVAAAENESILAITLEAIAQATGCPLLRLPLEEEFHIDLGFDLCGAGKRSHGAGKAPALVLDPTQRRLVAALQGGLELTSRPYAALGQRATLSEEEVLSHLGCWCDDGVIKRFGVVVRHHELGYRANAMVVFDVPDAEVGAIGRRLAEEDDVTLCYRRRRQLPDWPYNLFCMVHGRSRMEVLPAVTRLSRIVGTPGLPLFSLRRFKQQGARYVEDSRVGAP
jgi:DNA-binding Lrp family transcriptional regulator